MDYETQNNKAVRSMPTISQSSQEKKYFETYIDGRHLFNNQLQELFQRTNAATERLDCLSNRINANEYPKNSRPTQDSGKSALTEKDGPSTLLTELSQCSEHDDRVYRQIDCQLSEIFEAIAFLEKHF